MMKSNSLTNPLSSLPSTVRSTLISKSRRVEGIRGQILIQKGDRISGVFLVQKGTLRVFAMHENGKEATLYRVSADEICLLSLNCTFTGVVYPAWVGVDSKTAQASIIPGDWFRDLFQKEKSIQDLMIHSLTVTVKELLVKVDEALLSSLRDRIYSFLVCNADSKGQVKITHGELALHLGSSREVISREIAALKRAKIIDSTRGNIVIRDRKV